MVTARYGHYGQRAARIGPNRIIMPDTTSRIRFCSAFLKKAWIILCKTDPDPIWMVLSKFGQTSGPEASRCAGIIGSGFWQNATSPLPVSQFQTRFRSSTDVPDNTVQNQPGSDLVPADCVRFWPKRIRSGSNPVCKNRPARFWPMLPSRSGPDTNRIRHVYWDNTYIHNITIYTYTY